MSDWSSDVCSSDLLAMNGGRAIQLFFKIVAEEVAQAKQNEKLTKFAEALEQANGQLQAATMWLMQNSMTNHNNAGAAAYRYMHIMGIVAVGLMWLRTASDAARTIEAGEGDGRFIEAKNMPASADAVRSMTADAPLSVKRTSGK